VKAGKFVTLLGYEVIESPNNLNLTVVPVRLRDPLHARRRAPVVFARGLADRHAGRSSLGVAKDNNDSMSVTGQFALSRSGLHGELQLDHGPEQASNTTHPRTVLDWTATYTGLKNVTLGAKPRLRLGDQGGSLVASGTRNDTDASWWGIAVRGYDWTEQLRTASAPGVLADPGERCVGRPRPRLQDLAVEGTGTLQYKIWRGSSADSSTSRPGEREGLQARETTGSRRRRRTRTPSASRFISFF